jgi:hypothetical protein
MLKRILVGLVAVVALANTAISETIDIRNCPLDTTVFIDPWAGGSFSIKRVGEHWIYLCASGITENPPDAENCSGPFGKFVLVGDLKRSEGASAEEIIAVYHIDDAAPCCGWNVYQDGSQAFENVVWLDPEEIPLLGDLPFAVIEPEKSAIFGNPKIAMVCTPHK